MAFKDGSPTLPLRLRGVTRDSNETERWPQKPSKGLIRSPFLDIWWRLEMLRTVATSKVTVREHQKEYHAFIRQTKVKHPSLVKTTYGEGTHHWWTCDVVSIAAGTDSTVPSCPVLEDATDGTGGEEPAAGAGAPPRSRSPSLDTWLRTSPRGTILVCAEDYDLTAAAAAGSGRQAATGAS